MAMFNNASMDGTKLNDDSFETIIGPLVQVEGELNSQGNVRIEGKFKGTLKVAHMLKLGKESHIEADVTVGSAFIAGKITGNVTSTGLLELSETAHIEGDVHAGTIVMAAGAIMNGACKMGQKIQYASDDSATESATTDSKEEKDG